ncbi:hypothetical protein WR25_18297 [Diploscapter pachys]|uniref:Uncharacterized protein n=1 Tax=Diploscapter pachys TaxID=2018661 RepID=A0A2A2LEB8_9BILA|nr:hypothetical protein WR25_18297 [Diploscapter pachys]
MTELNQARGATKSLLEELRNYRATERKLTVLKDMAVQFEKEADKTIGMMKKRLSDLEEKYGSTLEMEVNEWNKQLESMQRVLEQCRQMGLKQRGQGRMDSQQKIETRRKLNNLELLVEDLIRLDNKAPVVEEKVRTDAIYLKEAEDKMPNLLMRCRTLDELSAELNCHSGERNAQLRKANAVVKLLALRPNCDSEELESLRMMSSKLEQLIGAYTFTETSSIMPTPRTTDTLITVKTAPESTTTSGSAFNMTSASGSFASVLSTQSNASSQASNNSTSSTAHEPERQQQQNGKEMPAENNPNPKPE